MARVNFAVETSAAQVKLKRAIVDCVMANKSREETFKQAEKIIAEYCKQINDVTLQQEFQRILQKSVAKQYNAFLAQYSQIGNDYGLPLLLIAGIFRGDKKAVDTVERSGKTNAEQVIKIFNNIQENKSNGVSEDYTEYIFPDKIPVVDVREKVKQAILDLAQEETESGDGHNLRNRAEMFVRYEAQRQSIENMRASGIQLVWCSTHGDCSKRCAPYQGRLYSLNHKSGEIDGHKYVPLEHATDNPRDRYVTRAGRVYQNGLFGFNCRHRLIPYNSHQAPPKAFTPAQMRELRKVDAEQRRMELEIRKIKTKAWVCRSQNYALSNDLFAEARRMTEEYRKYCRSHDRVALIYRTQVMTEEQRINKYIIKGN